MTVEQLVEVLAEFPPDYEVCIAVAGTEREIDEVQTGDGHFDPSTVYFLI